MGISTIKSKLKRGLALTQKESGDLWEYIRSLESQPCEDVLDKIGAEIEEHAKINQNINVDRARALCWCLDVIDKYKAESEEESDSE